MITFIISFSIAFIILSICSLFLLFSKKNIKGRCGSPESCESCTKKCKKGDL